MSFWTPNFPLNRNVDSTMKVSSTDLPTNAQAWHSTLSINEISQFSRHFGTALPSQKGCSPYSSLKTQTKQLLQTASSNITVLARDKPPVSNIPSVRKCVEEPGPYPSLGLYKSKSISTAFTPPMWFQKCKSIFPNPSGCTKQILKTLVLRVSLGKQLPTPCNRCPPLGPVLLEQYMPWRMCMFQDLGKMSTFFFGKLDLSSNFQFPYLITAHSKWTIFSRLNKTNFVHKLTLYQDVPNFYAGAGSRKVWRVLWHKALDKNKSGCR